jgi:hypothetical protein
VPRWEALFADVLAESNRRAVEPAGAAVRS